MAWCCLGSAQAYQRAVRLLLVKICRIADLVPLGGIVAVAVSEAHVGRHDQRHFVGTDNAFFVGVAMHLLKGNYTKRIIVIVFTHMQVVHSLADGWRRSV
ncbi:predicted membrane protein [Zymobacter palmae]|uniref:Predicted membrane protein n=1 Tax=Zymobacter palmae TaxID=33074 RepID=A0A348HBJ8_9GAMM|nr:predicted membrane protein [Zymobacter palmae]